MIKLEFYIPRWDLEGVRDIETLLENLKESRNIDFKKIIVAEDQEKKLKSDMLWGLSVYRQIKIDQSRKAKSLYPHLIVLVNNKPITFYPQERPKEKITIQEFLKGLLNDEVKCLHDKYEIEDELTKLEHLKIANDNDC